jgi:fido (protein-threonine AMPylation protein)
MYVVQLRSPLAVRNVPIWPGELMALHKDIFGEAFPELAGTGRTQEIDIRGDRCSPPEHIGQHLAEFGYWLNPELEALESDDVDDEERFAVQVELLAMTHAKLLHIHPFVDGNGRTARVLLNLMLRRFELRPIEVKTDDDYTPALRRAIHGDTGQFVALVIRLMDRENERLIRDHERRLRRARR